MHEKERFVQRGGVFGLDDVVGDFDASGVEAVRGISDISVSCRSLRLSVLPARVIIG